jgi:hypothetical protein
VQVVTSSSSDTLDLKEETIGSMGSMKEIADTIGGDGIPRLKTLRRIPTPYRQTLPLNVIKQYQCLVVGAARGVLTVAITDAQDRLVIEALSALTGQRIFPVLVDPVRMRLLIRRMERYERRRGASGHPYYSKGCIYVHCFLLVAPSPIVRPIE